MDDLDSIPRFTSPLLYVFNGELFRIGAFINENLKYVKLFTGYGEMYGLYTHSHGGVVHVTTFQNFNQRQLLDALSHPAKAIPHDYKLSLIGGWFTVQDTNLSVCELLRSKANILKESETYFCIVVDKPRSKFNFQDISGLTQAFYLVKGEVYKTDMKILNRESPFRFDTEFSDMILSAGHTAADSVENEDLSNKLEYVGTEMKDFSSKKMEANIALANSENLLDHDRSKLSESPSGTNERDYPADMSVDKRTVENSVVKKPQPVSSKKLKTDNAPENSENLLDPDGSELPELPSETREGDTPVEDGAEENSMVKKPQQVLPMKDASLESNTSEKNSESDRETWVDVKPSDVDSFHVSPTGETWCEATSSENDKKNKVDPNAGSLDDEQKESMSNNSVPEKNGTLENENKIDEDQRTPENDEDKDIRKEDNVTKNEHLLDEGVSATTDRQVEKNMTTKSKDEITVEKQQEEDNGSSEKISTRKDTTEKNIVPGTKDLQEIENDGVTKSGATVETEIIDENNGDSMACVHNNSDDEKSLQKEIGENKNEENEENKNVKSDEVPTSENLLSTKEFFENHEPSGDVYNEMKTSSESTTGERLPNDGAFEEALVTEDSSKDKQVGTEQNNSTSEVEGQKNSSLPNTDVINKH